MSIVAIDPGGSTGLAYTDSINFEPVKFQTLTGQHHLELYDFLNMIQPKVICLERFVWRPKYTELVSVEYIGVVKLWVQTWTNSVKLIERKPSDAKIFITDEKLKRLGMWKDRSPHERDAARHLLCYLILDLKSPEWILRSRPAQ